MRTTTSLTAVARALSLVAVLLAADAVAVGETTGRLKGGVYDAAGAPMADMPLVLKSSKLLQPQRRKSRKDGTFSFDQLPPGEDYALETVGAGFAGAQEKNIKIQLGQTTSMDLMLGGASETLVVRASNPAVNPDTAATGQVVTAAKAAATPIFGQVEAMAQLAPGVGPGNRPSTRGGLSRYTKYYVDGMDTSDITDGAITAPMNFNAVENFQLITGGQDAQYNSMGSVQNIVTKTGGNELTYDAQVVISPDWMNASSRTGSGTPGPFGQFTEPTEVKPAVTSFYAPHLNIGGPIIKDRMWFFASAQMNMSTRNVLLTFRDGTQEVRPNDTTTLLARMKVTYQLTQDDKVSAAVNLDHNTIENLIGSSSFTRDAENRIDRGGYFFIINYDHNFSPELSFTLQTGTTFKGASTEPSSGTFAASHRDLNQNLTQFQGGSIRLQSGAFIPGNFLRELKYRYTFDPVFNYRWFDHDIKFGLQGSYMQSTNTTGVIGQYRYTDRGGVCNESDPATYGFCVDRAEFFNATGARGDLTTLASNINVGGFISDRWNVNRHLTFIPGFRIDVGQVKGDANALGTLVGLGPRLSATFDPLGDRRIIFTGYYGRSNDIGDVFLSQRGNPDLYTVTSRWDSVAKVFPACTPTSVAPGCTVTGGPASKTFRSGMTPPHTDEFMLGVKTELFQDTAFGIDFSYRHYGNLWVERETNRIWDVSGMRVVGFVDGQPHSIIQIDNPDSAYRDYKGVDFWIDGSPGKWTLSASYTLSLTTGTVDDYFDGYMTNPRQTMFYEGTMSVDTRHAVKGSVGYKVGWGLDVTLRAQYRTGTPLWESFLNPFDNSTNFRRSWRGTGFAYTGNTSDFNNPDQIAEMRNPDFMQFDAQARYDLGSLLHTRERIDITLMLVNALNTTSPTAYNDAWFTSGTNTFGGVASRMRPLQAEIILRFYN